MQDQNYKCSVHKDIDAIRYCGECNAFYCNKCEKLHSELNKYIMLIIYKIYLKNARPKLQMLSP